MIKQRSQPLQAFRVGLPVQIGTLLKPLCQLRQNSLAPFHKALPVQGLPPGFQQLKGLRPGQRQSRFLFRLCQKLVQALLHLRLFFGLLRIAQKRREEQA